MGGYLLRILIAKNGATIPPRKRYGSFLRLIINLIAWILFKFAFVLFLEIQLDALMGSLNRKGERELSLDMQLEKFYDRIWSV